MEKNIDGELGPMLRRFTYDKGGVGRFLVGIFALPLVLLGLIAAVLVPLTAGRGNPLRGTASDVFSAGLCLLLVSFFGYWLWSARQVSGHRTAVFTVHEGGLVHSLARDDVLGLPEMPGRVIIPWTAVVDVVERRRTSPARWLLPPSQRYKAAVVVDEGWALTFTDATKGAVELAAMVRARSARGHH